MWILNVFGAHDPYRLPGRQLDRVTVRPGRQVEL
jgi:hypothetical protein